MGELKASVIGFWMVYNYEYWAETDSRLAMHIVITDIGIRMQAKSPGLLLCVVHLSRCSNQSFCTLSKYWVCMVHIRATESSESESPPKCSADLALFGA
jgi:hypothetical protein